RGDPQADPRQSLAHRRVVGIRARHVAYRSRGSPAHVRLLQAGVSMIFPAIGMLALTVISAAAQSVSKETYDFNFIGQPLADPVLQHAKETFVLFGCAYCHGLNLVARGEATDLMHSGLVGRDMNGNLIGPLLRAGIPQTAKLSPMPQFSDLSDQQIG